jgi:hypothetical protein
MMQSIISYAIVINRLTYYYRYSRLKFPRILV